MADNCVLALAFMFAELRTITIVIGNPPIRPDIALPIPCAFNSLLVGDMFLSGSSLSVASTLNKVSILPTMAIVSATIQTWMLAR